MMWWIFVLQVKQGLFLWLQICVCIWKLLVMLCVLWKLCRVVLLVFSVCVSMLFIVCVSCVVCGWLSLVVCKCGLMLVRNRVLQVQMLLVLMMMLFVSNVSLMVMCWLFIFVWRWVLLKCGLKGFRFRFVSSLVVGLCVSDLDYMMVLKCCGLCRCSRLWLVSRLKWLCRFGLGVFVVNFSELDMFRCISRLFGDLVVCDMGSYKYLFFWMVVLMCVLVRFLGVRFSGQCKGLFRCVCSIVVFLIVLVKLWWVILILGSLGILK